MIFYTSKKEDLEMIPSSYIIVAFTRHSTPETESGNIIRLNNALMPDKSFKSSGDENKKKYKDKLKTLKGMVAYLAKTGLNSPSNSLVLYCDPKLKEELSFNPVKTMVKFLYSNYNLNCFKFTNCVTRDMRIDAKMSNEDEAKLLADCTEIYSLF